MEDGINESLGSPWGRFAACRISMSSALGITIGRLELEHALWGGKAGDRGGEA